MNPKITDLEHENLEKYSGKVYHANTITILPSANSKIHANVVLQIRINLAAQYARSAKVLDLCCGTGEHLMSLADIFRQGIGLDYSMPFIMRANQTKSTAKRENVEFVEGHARVLPFSDDSFDLVYSFSALYYIPRVEQVIFEVSRVLKPGGKCVIDLGNLYSFNTIVCRAHPELAYSFHVSVSAMKRFFRESELTILEHRAFQILPLWADRPWWMRPLLSPLWTRLLERQFKGKMLDEWICNLPVFNFFAFRHVFVCEKPRI